MIVLGSDHAGYALKEAVKTHLEQNGKEYKDLGTYNCDSVDYISVAKSVCDYVLSCEDGKGLLFCGTGVGMSIAANKIKGIRAACCSDYFSAKLTRLHNNANVLCLGGRVVGTGLANELVDIFLNTEFCGDERHQKRIDMISAIENIDI